jgi:hypothetical protein
VGRQSERDAAFPESADKGAARTAFRRRSDTGGESAAYEAHLDTDPESREPIDPPDNRYSNRVRIRIAE